MLEQISTYFTIEMVYLWLNIGVIPFWMVLIFLPNSKILKHSYVIFLLDSSEKIAFHIIFNEFQAKIEILNQNIVIFLRGAPESIPGVPGGPPHSYPQLRSDRYFISGFYDAPTCLVGLPF